MNRQTLRYIIFAGLFAVPFIPFLVSSSFFFPFIVVKAFAWRLIVEIIFASWILLAILDKSYRPKISLVLYSVIGFLGAICLSTIFSVDITNSFWSNYERMEGYISLLHLGVFFLVAGSVLNESHWKKWWNTSLFASFLMVFYTFLQLAGLITINQGGVRIDGTFGNATYLAVYMLFHVFVTLLFLLRNWQNKSARWLYGVLALLQIIVVYHTATRGTIIGLLGGLLIVGLLNLMNREDAKIRRLSRIFIVLLLVIVGGLILARNQSFVTESPVLSRFTNLSVEEFNRGGRWYTWPMAVEGFKERPILGWGQENFIYVFQEYYKPEMYRLEPWFDRAHNIFLDWLVAGGLVGLLAYLSLYVALLYVVWSPSQNFSYIERSVITGLIAAYFFHNFFVFDHLMSYVLFFSLLAYMHQRSSGKLLWQGDTQRVWLRKTLVPMIVVVTLFPLYFWNVKPMLANLHLIGALKSVQLQRFVDASLNFEKAYSTSTSIGQAEVVQHLAANSIVIFSSSISQEEKNDFYAFAREVVIREVNGSPNNVRIGLIAGSFLSSTGQFQDALDYLNKARELMPGKQQIYFEIASLYINAGEREAAIDTLNYVSQISPDHKPQMDEYIRQIRAGEI